MNNMLDEVKISVIFSVNYPSKLGANYANTRFKKHQNGFIIIIDGKVHREFIIRKHRIVTPTLVNDACFFHSMTDLTKMMFKLSQKLH
jgi:hypothetical protein